MTTAVAQRLVELMSNAGLTDYDGGGGSELLDQLRDGKTPRLVKTLYGYTLAHYACRHGWLDFVIYLIQEHNCNPNAETKNGLTPLHYACRYGHIDIVRYLISEQHCNPECCDKHHQAPLHYLCGWDRECTEEEALEIMNSLVYTTAKCDVNKRDKDGKTALIKACSSGDTKTAHYLISEGHCDVTISDSDGHTALHVACCHNQTDEISKLLLEETKTNPNVKNYHGDTPLHLACKSENFNLVELLVRDQRCNPLEKNSEGDTVLHVACRLYQRDEISTLLLEQAKIDPNVKNNDGDTPLHLACKSGNSNIVKLLVRDQRCNPHEKDNEGDTVLHVACRLYQKDEILKSLLEGTKINPNVKNNNGHTPLDLTRNTSKIRELIRHGANPRDVYKTHGKLLGKFSSLQTPVKLFMVGNPSAGKSTLTKALQSEMTRFVRLVTRLKPVSGVNEKTAGIVPHEFESKTYGRVTLYDFAGQREFYGSHAALLQNAIQASTPIFLVVVDLNESDDDIKQNIFYWLSFLENQCTSVSSKPHIVVIGSHADILKSRGKHKASFITFLLSTLQFSSLEFTGFIAMDCQYADSAGMRELHQVLKTSCDRLRTQESIDFNAHCFLVYLLDKFRDSVAVTFRQIQSKISKDDVPCISDEDITYFLPQTNSALTNVCDQLNDRGHLLVLKNPTSTENTCVIIDRTALLAEVNGTIFAPEGFKEHIKLASSTGVVPLSNIAKHFPKHDLTMLVGFLSHLEFCHEISDPEILGLINQEQASTTASEVTGEQGERYFFFPGLVTLEVPSKVWEPQPQFDYQCGWILQCSRPEQFFDARFLQVLLLRLAFSFAFAQENLHIEEDIPALQRKCSVWKNGVYWGNIHGIETLVEVAEQNRVVVLMRCPEVKSECLRLRSLLIQKVLAAAREFCSKVSTCESFINPSDTTQYPLKSTSQLTLFSVKSMASVVVEGVQSAAVVDKTGKPVSLGSLLSFEPYADLGEPILRELFAENDQRKAQISSIADRIPDKNTEIIKKIFQPNPTQFRERTSEQSVCSPVFHILDMWRDSCKGTYKCLREKLDQFSVFAGRNPLELADVSCKSLSTGSSVTTPQKTETTEYVNIVVSPDDVDMLADLLSEVAGHWDLFLGQLGVPPGVRDELRHDNARMPKFSKRCLLEGLHRWVESEDKPTYAKITAALRGYTVSDELLAQRVEEFAETHNCSPC